MVLKRVRRTAVLFVAFLVFLLPGKVSGTTIREFTLSDLVQFAEIAGRVTVVSAVAADTKVHYTLAIDDLLLGTPLGPQIMLTLDEGVVGMPHLVSGRTYVLFMNLSNQIEKIISLSPGVLEVRNEGLYSLAGSPVALEKYPGRAVGAIDVQRSTEGGRRLLAAKEPLPYASFRASVLSTLGELTAAGARLESRKGQ